MRIRGHRHYLFTGPISEDAARILTSVPGVEVERDGGSTRIGFPVHTPGVIVKWLTDGLASRGLTYTWISGWRSWKGKVYEQKSPPPLEPDGFPAGLTPEAKVAAYAHQHKIWARFLAGEASPGCSLEEVPMGGGKTFIGLGIAAHVAAHGWRVLIVVQPGTEGQWDSQATKWLDPTALLGVTTLVGENGYEVKVYKDETRTMIRPTVTEEHARLVLGRWSKGAIELWKHGKATPTAHLRKLVAEALAEEVTEVVRSARVVIRSKDTGEVVATIPADYTSLTADAQGVRTVSAVEYAEARAVVMNSGLSSETPIIVCSYALLAARRESLRAWNPDLVILDESHMSKSLERWNWIPADQPGGKPTAILKDSQAAAAWYVSERASAVLEMTGCPDPDRRRDLWAQYDILDPRGHGSFKIWSARYCGGRNREIPHTGRLVWDSTGDKVPPNPVMEAELARRAAMFHHRTPKSESHQNVPPINRQMVWLSGKQVGKAEDISAVAWRTANKEQKHSMLLDSIAASKGKEAVRRCKERLLEGMKGILLTGTHASADNMFAHLVKLRGQMAGRHGHQQPIQVILSHGATEGRDSRAETLAAFLAYPGPALLIGTLAAWGQGWDGLHHVDWATIIRFPYNHGTCLQVEGRFERIGGKHSVLVEYLMLLRSMEERILRMVLDKADANLRVFGDEEVAKLKRGLAEEDAEDRLLDAMFASLASQTGGEGSDLDTMSIVGLVEAALRGQED